MAKFNIFQRADGIQFAIAEGSTTPVASFYRPIKSMEWIPCENTVKPSLEFFDIVDTIQGIAFDAEIPLFNGQNFDSISSYLMTRDKQARLGRLYNVEMAPSVDKPITIDYAKSAARISAIDSAAADIVEHIIDAKFVSVPRHHLVTYVTTKIIKLLKDVEND